MDVFTEAPLGRVYRSPTWERVYRSPTRERVYRSPTRERVYRSPTRERVYRSPTRERVYRSPTWERVSTMDTTTKVNEAVQRKSSHLLICGDFNYPHIDWECEFIDEISNKRPLLDTGMKEVGTESITATEKALNSFFSSNFTNEKMELPNDERKFLCE